MKIVDVVTERFRYRSRRARDSEGHSHPGPERAATECVLKIVTDDGAEGYVHVSQRPGLDEEINWEYIREHRVTR